MVVLALVSAQATFAALGAPARRTFVSRLLPAEQVAAGIALTHLGFQVAMLAGPAVAGLIIGAFGVEVCYAIDVLTFAAMLYGVRGLPPMRPGHDSARDPVHGSTDDLVRDKGDGAAGGRAWLADVCGGLRFVLTQPVVGGAFLTDILATVLAMPAALFPVLNEERFGGNPETLGLFFTAIAVGGVAAGLASGTITRMARPGFVMLIAAATWGLGLVAAGLAQHLWLVLGGLAIAGAADTLSVISRGTIVQLATPDGYRGRVSSVEHIVGASGPDLGNFRAGVLAGFTSATVTLVAGGVLCAAGVAALAAGNRSLRQFVARTGTDVGVDARADAGAGAPTDRG